jgi:AsmA protein
MKKTLKITGIALAIILIALVFLVLTPLIFKEKFAVIVKNTANKTLKTEMNFSEMDVSFFHHFPELTITLTGFSLKSSAPFTRDTLIKARDISFGVNLLSIIKGPLKITKVYLNKARVVIQYNEKGASNFEVYNTSSDTISHSDTSSTQGAALKIEHIVFIQTDFIYSDASIPLKLVAHGINYSGKSDLSNGIFRLSSRVRIDSLDFYYNRIPYLKSKPVKAELRTSVNLSSLDMKFEKNDLYIKNIPFEFRGELSFQKNGYSFFISLFSMFGDEYISGSLMLNSSKNLWLSAKADINLDLDSWTKGLGISDLSLGGMFSMKLKAQGEYSSGQNPASKKPNTILLSIPDFTISSTLRDGSFRYRKFPQALTGISFNLKASSANHDYRSVSLQLENLKAGFMKNRIEGYFRLNGLKDLPLESRLSTSLNLAELGQLIPLDSLDLKGMLDINLDVKGKYAPAKKLFPLAQLILKLKDGAILTKYYPRPVEKIQLDATVTNNSGKLADTRIKLDPASFSFEGNPFEIKAELSNPDNIDYTIVSKGSIDIASIYHVFSYKGMDLKGFISTDLNLKGRQSDAMAGRVEKLHNSGKLTLRNIAFTSEYLPKPLVVKSGVFRFENDKIWFEKFESRYGASDITLNGHLSNVLNYCLAKNQTLKGSLNFSSGYLLADEFMAPENTETAPPANIPAKDNKQPASSGVIVIPDNLEIGLKADLKKISFRKLNITDLSAAVEVKKGMLLLKNMQFQLIGCKVGMDATYGSISTNRAFFDFHIKAEDFDIKRAYNEIELFRNLSSSAGKCEGIISLDYTLKGKLDAGMNPVYPSLEGGGVISLKKVKVIGLKLFTAMSKNLDKEKIKEPDLSKVEIRSSIKNNVITIEKTKMKIAGFRFRIGGETNFDGRLNLKARLGLPPLGIVGIPIRVLGTQENPKFKYGRGNSDENVDETEYSDEIPQEMLDKIRSAKEEDLKDEPL